MIPYNDFSSDLAVLNERCLKNQIPSPVKFTQSGKPCIENRIHIDLYEVFRKELTRGTIFKNKYRTLKLEDVSHALIGKGKYGSGAISGANVHTLSIEEQKQYVLQDAQLVMDLSKTNNGQVMSLMQAISQLTGLSLEQVCHSSLSTWWTKVFDDMECVPSQFSGQDEEARNQQPTEYQGGLVIEPKRGLYRNLKVVDVVSLYPSVAILHNISFDTVNCACCVNRKDAKVSADVIDKDYWICKKREGAFPRNLREFKEERVRQKQLGNEVKQLGLKILINGGYGLFGNPAFKYADVRVAELITAFGRYTLRQMQDIASKLGFSVVAGDTDSLFLNSASNNENDNIPRFIAECKEKIGVDVEHSETFVKAAIIKKKHYFGVTTNGEIKAVGMEGKKNDRPVWINNVFGQFLEEYKADRDPTANLKAAINDLENGKINPELLKIKVRLAKDPAEYAVNNPNKKIGMLLGAKAGDVIWYFKTDDKKGGVTINPEEIGIYKYKEMLMATVKDALEILSRHHRIECEAGRSNQSSSFFELQNTQLPQCHPFVKWAGGKTQLLPELEKYMPDKFSRYFEPFLGGGAFFFHLATSKQLKFTAYLSDANNELIDAYKVIKDNVEGLIELLKVHEKGYKANPVEYYYKLRSIEYKSLTDIESAARFITLNKTCFNGLYRVNKDGIFNVPIGKFKNPPLICDSKNLRNVSTALKHTNANLFVNDYQETLELAREGDFIYLDPPYKPTSTTASFTSYTNDGFGDKDQIALYETFKKLDRKGCKIMLSNSDTPYVREMYTDFNQYTSQVSSLRAINSKATKRTGHTELIVRNYEK